ncbi:hypothetical protein EVJ58_g11022, partial [Rhodofomes roseus]
MASFVARSALRAARRAPRVAVQAVAKPSQSAAYSVLARTAAATSAKRTSVTGARGVKTLNFAGTDEVVYERSDWPLAKLQDYFKNDTLALIGYGSQG